MQEIGEKKQLSKYSSRAFDCRDFRKVWSISFKRLILIYLPIGSLLGMMLGLIFPTSAVISLSGILLPWVILYAGQSRALALGMLLGFTVNLFAPVFIWGDLALAYVIAVAAFLIVRHRLPHSDMQALLYMSIGIPLIVGLIVHCLSAGVFLAEISTMKGTPAFSIAVNILAACILGPLLVIPASELIDYLTGRKS
jgi:hypothetical protein